MPLTLTDVDVNAALDEALFLVQNQFALQNITLERELGPASADPRPTSGRSGRRSPTS